MKKVFALFMVSALLAFAGSAFAASPTITADPSSVMILPGLSATVTLTAAAANNGELGPITVTGGTASDWASVSGSTLTITAPVTATQGGSYTVEVSVTETYSENPGHSEPQTATGTATVNVTIGFLPPVPVISPRTSSINLYPGQTETRTVSATAERGGTLVYEKVSGPDWATLDGTTITFAPPADALGSFTLVISVTETASDGQTGTDYATFNIGVGWLGQLMPTIAANPTSITVIAGQSSASEITLTGTTTPGAENSTLAFSKVNGPSWALVLTSGVVAVQPPENAEATSYTLTVRVTERAAGWTTGTADLDIPITVQAPPFTEPTITLSLQSITMTRGAGAVTATVTGTASRSGILEYSLSAPEWVTLTMNGNTGTLTLNPGATVEPTQTDPYSATVTVTETATGYRPGKAKAAIVITVVRPKPPTPKPTISANTYTVSMTAGDPAQTVTITGTASQGGTLTYEKVSGPEWATLNGTTLTAAPGIDVVANDYPVRIAVTETTGAGTEDMLTGSATTDPIVITVARNESSTVPEQTEDEKAEIRNRAGVDTDPEGTTSETHEESITVLTKTEGTKISLPEELTVKADVLASSATKPTSTAMVEQGFSQEDAAQTEENVNATLNDTTTMEEFGTRLAIGSDATGGRVDKSDISTGEVTGNELSDANDYLAGQAQDTGVQETAVGGMSETSSSTGGWWDFLFSFARQYFGMSAKLYRNQQGTTGNNGTLSDGVMAAGRVIAAAEDNGNEAIFLNSNGDVVDVIPGENDPSGALPGVVTVVTYLEPNVVYKPIIAVEVEKLPAEVKEQVEEETVEITVETTTTSTFTAQSNSFFSTRVSWDLISSTVYTNNLQYYRISDDTGGRINSVQVGEDWTRTDAECNAMVANDDYDVSRVVRLPALDGKDETEDHVYVVAVNFEITDANRADILESADGGGFVFYPDGPLGNTATARVMKVVEAAGDVPAHFETLTVDEFKSSNITKGYLAFWIPAGTELTRPMLAVKLEKSTGPEPGPGPEPEPESDDFYITASTRYVTVTLNDTALVTYTAANASGDVTYSISPSADWVALTTVNNEATVTILPTDSALIASSPNTFTVSAIDEAGNTDSESLSITVTRQSRVPGSSGGGGCSAGFSALALAVLGAFIARRKK